MLLGRGGWLHVRFRSGRWVNCSLIHLTLVVYYVVGICAPKTEEINMIPLLMPNVENR